MEEIESFDSFELEHLIEIDRFYNLKKKLIEISILANKILLPEAKHKNSFKNHIQKDMEEYLQSYSDEKPRNKQPKQGFLSTNKLPNRHSTREETANFVEKFYQIFNKK